MTDGQCVPGRRDEASESRTMRHGDLLCRQRASLDWATDDIVTKVRGLIP
jgi:hypothetical protein